MTAISHLKTQLQDMREASVRCVRLEALQSGTKIETRWECADGKAISMFLTPRPMAGSSSVYYGWLAKT